MASVATAVGIDLVTNPVQAAAELPGSWALGSIADAASELLGGNRSRRRWSADDRCWIEVHGLGDTAPDGRLGELVTNKLRAQPGVRSVKLNFPLSRAIVRIDTDVTSAEELCDIVEVAEREASQEAEEAPRHIDLPADAVVLAASTAAAAASAAGLVLTLVGRSLFWPRLPVGVAAAVTLVDYQPRLRRMVEGRLGTDTADIALALAASVSYTLTQAPASLAVDLVMHLARAAETQSAAAAWRRREPALAERAECRDGIHPSERPRDRPPGPVERHGDRSGLAQAVGAAAIGFATANLNSAATASLVAVPKAARTSREAFAAVLGHGLAENHGVLPMTSEALRRLDRVDAVVLDPRALCTEELSVGRIRNMSDSDRAAAWQWAQDQIDCGRAELGWQRAPGSNGSRPAGEVLVRRTVHPLASAILQEARRAGAEVVSLDVDTLDDLRSAFDDLHPCDGTVDDGLAQLVNRLQTDGRTVLVVSGLAGQALADADVALGIGDRPSTWHADLIVDDLDGAWRIVHAVPAARRASERGVEIATGASLLGALLMVPGVRGRGPGPVTAGAGAGAWTGFWLARGVLGTALPPRQPQREWHALSVEQVRRLLPPPQTVEPSPQRSRLTASATTLTSATRSAVEPVHRNVREFAGALREELSDPLTPVLAIGSAASAVLGSPADAVLVGSVLTGNAVLAAHPPTEAAAPERLAATPPAGRAGAA